MGDRGYQQRLAVGGGVDGEEDDGNAVEVDAADLAAGGATAADGLPPDVPGDRLVDQVRRHPALGRGDRQRRPGRPGLRAPSPGLVDAERGAPGVPRRLPVPLGPAVLRRGGPGEGGRGRRGGGQHPPLRRPPGQRRRGAARARRGGLRRGARGRGGHDAEPRRRGDPGTVPGPGRRRPHRSCGTTTARRRSPTSPRWPTGCRRRWPGGWGRGSCGTRPPAGRPAEEPAGRGRARAAPQPPPAEEDVALGHLLELGAARVERLAGLVAAGPAAGRGRRAHGRRALSAIGHLAGDLARLAGRTADEVAWVDGTRRAPVLRLSPIDVGPAPGRAALGRGHRRAHQRHRPAAPRRAPGPGRVPAGRARRGQPLRLPGPLAALRGPAPARPAPPGVRAGAPRGAGGADAGGRGRTLALFTSRRATEAAAAALRERLPYRVLEQGELPKARLLAAFAEDESSCLFATLGFWQGVDVPGRSLSLVTLDRLPFPGPDDPLLQARRDRAGRRRLPAGRPAPGGHPARPGRRPARSARRTTAGWWPSSTPAWPPPATAACCWPGSRPCGATTDRRQVEDVPGRGPARPTRPTAVSSRAGRARRRAAASAAPPGRRARGRRRAGARPGPPCPPPSAPRRPCR